MNNVSWDRGRSHVDEVAEREGGWNTQGVGVREVFCWIFRQLYSALKLNVYYFLSWKQPSEITCGRVFLSKLSKAGSFTQLTQKHSPTGDF